MHLLHREHLRNTLALRLYPRTEVAIQSIVAAMGLSQNKSAASVRSMDLRLTGFFGSTYLCEEALSQKKIIKSRYRNRLTDEHSDEHAFTCA